MFETIAESEYPISYSAEILALNVSALVEGFSGKEIEVVEKVLSRVYGQRVRIEYDWVGHRGQYFFATSDDVRIQNVYEEDQYWDYYEDSLTDDYYDGFDY